MVEQLKKEDIIEIPRFELESEEGERLPVFHTPLQVVQVWRIKEVIGLAESLINEKRAEDKRLRGGISRATAIQVFRECFGVLFDIQSPKSRVCDLADNRTPSQDTSDSAESKPVGVSSPKKCKAFGNVRFASKGGKV